MRDQLNVEVTPAADGTHLLVTLWASYLRRGISIPLSPELSLQIQQLQNENIARGRMMTRPPELAEH